MCGHLGGLATVMNQRKSDAGFSVQEGIRDQQERRERIYQCTGTDSHPVTTRTVPYRDSLSHKKTSPCTDLPFGER